MKKAIFSLLLITAASTAAANSQEAAQLCAEEANKITGEKNFSLEKVRQPLLVHSTYHITLESAAAQTIECKATKSHLRSLSVDGEVKLAAK
ncbi:MAG: hypothetical protein ACE37D_12590 [Pseudomonadales bacterium]|jgi:hypothetical protein